MENGGTLSGGFSENQLQSYTAIADVTPNTNGLKTAEKQDDGSFTFSERTTGSYSGLKDTQLAVAADITPKMCIRDSNNSTVTGTVPYKEGIYYGTAEGYSGDVSVAVVIQEKTIKAILITESSDDERCV